MGGQTFIEKNGKLYYAVGDSGVGAAYTYTSIKSRNNKESVIQAVSYAKYAEENAYADNADNADNADIKLKVEGGKWKIDSFHSALQ